MVASTSHNDCHNVMRKQWAKGSGTTRQKLPRIHLMSFYLARGSDREGNQINYPQSFSRTVTLPYYEIENGDGCGTGKLDGAGVNLCPDTRGQQHENGDRRESE